MSSTILIELEDHTRTARQDGWTRPGILRDYAYPDDAADFADRIAATGLTFQAAEGGDRDIHEADDYQRLLDRLDPATRGIMPDPPEGWEHAEATITILW